jgi:hypothetical protein
LDKGARLPIIRGWLGQPEIYRGAVRWLPRCRRAANASCADGSWARFSD